MLNAQEDVITHVRMSIEIMTYVLQMSKLQNLGLRPQALRCHLPCRLPALQVRR